MLHVSRNIDREYLGHDADGRLIVRDILGVSNYQDDDGSFKPTDATIVDLGSGRKGVLSAELKTKHPLTRDEFVEFTTRDGALVKQRFIGIVLFDVGTKGYISLGLPTYAPTVVQSGNKIEFQGVYDGADLSYVHAGHKVKQEVRLSEAFRNGLSTPYPTEDTMVMFVTEVDSPDSVRFHSDSADVFDPATPERPEEIKVGDKLRFPLSEAFLADDEEQRWEMQKFGLIEDGRKLLFAGIPYADVKDTASFPGVMVLDPTVDLQGTSEVEDALLFWQAATTNYGSNTLIHCGQDDGSDQRHSLIRFDLSSIPSDVIISTATLTLQTNQGNFGGTVPVRIKLLKRAWGEGTCTWNTYNGSNNWSTAGATGASDVESSPYVDFTAPQHAGPGETDVVDVTTLVSALCGADATLTNYGFNLIANTATGEGVVYWRSSEYGAANGPKLSITYALPGGFKMLDGFNSPLIDGSLIQ